MRARFASIFAAVLLAPTPAQAINDPGSVHPSWSPVSQILEVCRSVYSSDSWRQYDINGELDGLNTTADWHSFFRKKETTAAQKLMLPSSLFGDVQSNCQSYENGRSDATDWLLKLIDKKDGAPNPEWPQDESKDPIVAVCRRLHAIDIAQVSAGTSTISAMTRGDIVSLERGRLLEILNQRNIDIKLLDDFEVHCFDYSTGANDATRWTLQNAK